MLTATNAGALIRGRRRGQEKTMKRVLVIKNNIVAGQYIAMNSEAELPDEIADDLIYRGQARLIAEIPDEKPRKSRKKESKE